VDSGTAVTAHSAGLAIVGVAAIEHLASASGIAVGVTDTGGAASAMPYAACSFVEVRRTG
jgi:hypothetical protein